MIHLSKEKGDYMSVFEQLANIKDLYEKFRECFYAIPDHPAPQNEYFVGEPFIPQSLFIELRDALIHVNDDLNSPMISEILEYMEEESNLDNYVMFDQERHQMDYIQEQPDAFDEGLSAVQQDAADNTAEENSRLWDEADHDTRHLIEELFPALL